MYHSISCGRYTNLEEYDEFSCMPQGDGILWTSRETLKTFLLGEELQFVMQSLESLKSSWQKYGCSIIADKQIDMKKRHIINILVSSYTGTKFLDAIDAFELLGQLISRSYIYGHIKNAIDYVGVENVSQVIIDNQSNYKHGEKVDGNISPHSMDAMCGTQFRFIN